MVAEMVNPSASAHLGGRSGRPPDLVACVTSWLTSTWLPMVGMVNARDGQWHVCFRPIATWVWKEAKADVGDHSYSTFLRAFHPAMRNVSLPHTSSDLKSCSKCFEIMAKRMQAVKRRDETRVDELEAEMQWHIAVQYAEKSIYWREREQVWAGDLDVLLISMDGTRPLNFPSFHRRTGLSDGCATLRYQAMTAIIHNDLANCSGLLGLYLGQGHEDGNVNISYLDHFLRARTERKLHLQLDGGSAAKSWPMVAYLGMLVEQKRFDEILVRFSITGHGGDMNDGFGGHMRVGVRAQECHSLASMQEKWPLFYQKWPLPDFVVFGDYRKMDGGGEPEDQLGLLYDWRTFLKPFYNGVQGYCQQNVSRTEDSIHVWRFRRAKDGQAVLQVKRLAQDKDELWSEQVRVLRSCPEGRPERVFFDEDNQYVGTLYKSPLETCNEVLEKLEGQMSELDEKWWKEARLFFGTVRMPTKFLEETARERKKAKPGAVVDTSKPPTLHVARKSKARYDLDDGAEVEEIPVPEDDQFDGEDPDWPVEAITRKKKEDGVVYYWVVWGKPYDDHGWQPVENLGGCQDKIEEFEQSQRGLRHYNKAHADLGRMLNEQAEEKAQKNRVGCRGCHCLFQAKGFSRHLKYCKHQVVE